MALVVRIDTAVEDSELYCYNTEGYRNSVVSQASCRIGWPQEENMDIQKTDGHKIF